MSTDSHDEMIRAFQEYIKWQNKFEYGKSQSNLSGRKARKALTQIRKAALARRIEILSKQKAKRALRKGVMGRPKNINKNK